MAQVYYAARKMTSERGQGRGLCRLTFAITGAQKQSEAPLLRVRVDDVVGRLVHEAQLPQPAERQGCHLLSVKQKL